jgi:hypothetical protein
LGLPVSPFAAALERRTLWSILTQQRAAANNGFMKTPARLVVSFFATLVSVIGHQPALAVTTNLTAVADTGLWSAAPGNNLGRNTFVPIGTSRTANNTGRGLIRFDLSAIPPNATINSATLTMVVTMDYAGSSTVSVQRMLKSWVEGTGSGFVSGMSQSFGRPALSGEPTWNRRASPSTLWGASGGLAGTDFVTAPTATAGPASSKLTFSSAGLAADVQLFVSNAATNFGWLFKQTVENGGARRISTREDTLNAPKLLVNYTVATPAMPATIFGEALVGNAIRFSFNAQSNLTYAVESLDTLGSTNWTVLTSIAAQPTNTVINVTNTISSSERYFRVRTP